MAMDRDLWRRAEELFHATLARPPESRAAFLDDACRGEADLRHQIGLLVASDGRSSDFLETPAFLQLDTAPPVRGSLVGRQLGTYDLLSNPPERSWRTDEPAPNWRPEHCGSGAFSAPATTEPSVDRRVRRRIPR